MRTDTFKGNYYVTSFCNFVHRIKDGMPVNHECHMLNPKGLAAEMRGDYTFQPFASKRITRGIKREFA